MGRGRWRLGVGALAALSVIAAALPLRTWGAPAVTNLTFSGGTVMASTTTYAIFWLPPGVHFESSGNDTTYESIVQGFLTDVGGTSFYNIVTQYPGGGDAYPANSSTFGGSYIDTTSYPRPGTASAPLQDGDIQASINRAIAAKGWTADPTHLFLVYTGNDIRDCLGTSTEQCSTDTFCAYHSAFTPSSGSQPVIYAALPDAAGNGGTCLSRGSSGTYPNGDSAADSEVSLTSKELFAAVTDPNGDAWTDATGAEIGDKCDWDFGTIAADGSNVTLNNGHKYLVQREWSNDSSSCVLSYSTRSSRLTPTPPVVGTPTPTPTPVSGRSSRPHLYYFLEWLE